MSLSYDQFRGILPDAALRASFGFQLSDDEAQALLADSDAAARYYGAWLQDQTRPGVRSAAPTGPRTSGYAVAAFVLSLLTILGGLSRIGGLIVVLLGIVGLALAFTARSDIKRAGLGGSSMATAAIPLTLVGIGFAIAGLIGLAA